MARTDQAEPSSRTGAHQAAHADRPIRWVAGDQARQPSTLGLRRFLRPGVRLWSSSLFTRSLSTAGDWIWASPEQDRCLVGQGGSGALRRPPPPPLHCRGCIPGASRPRDGGRTGSGPDYRQGSCRPRARRFSWAGYHHACSPRAWDRLRQEAWPAGIQAMVHCMPPDSDLPECTGTRNICVGSLPIGWNRSSAVHLTCGGGPSISSFRTTVQHSTAGVEECSRNPRVARGPNITVPISGGHARAPPQLSLSQGRRVPRLQASPSGAMPQRQASVLPQAGTFSLHQVGGRRLRP